MFLHCHASHPFYYLASVKVLRTPTLCSLCFTNSDFRRRYGFVSTEICHLKYQLIPLCDDMNMFPVFGRYFSVDITRRRFELHSTRDGSLPFRSILFLSQTDWLLGSRTEAFCSEHWAELNPNVTVFKAFLISLPGISSYIEVEIWLVKLKGMEWARQDKGPVCWNNVLGRQSKGERRLYSCPHIK